MLCSWRRLNQITEGHVPPRELDILAYLDSTQDPPHRKCVVHLPGSIECLTACKTIVKQCQSCRMNVMVSIGFLCPKMKQPHSSQRCAYLEVSLNGTSFIIHFSRDFHEMNHPQMGYPSWAKSRALIDGSFRGSFSTFTVLLAILPPHVTIHGSTGNTLKYKKNLNFI